MHVSVMVRAVWLAKPRANYRMVGLAEYKFVLLIVVNYLCGFSSGCNIYIYILPFAIFLIDQ